MIKNAEFWDTIEKVARRIATDEEHRKLYGILDRQRAPGAAYGAAYGALTMAGGLAGGAIGYKLTRDPIIAPAIAGAFGAIGGSVAGHAAGRRLAPRDWRKNYEEATAEMKGKRYFKTPAEVGAVSSNTEMDGKTISTLGSAGVASGATYAAVSALDEPVNFKPKGKPAPMRTPSMKRMAYIERLLKKAPKYALVGGVAGTALGALGSAVDSATSKRSNKKIEERTEKVAESGLTNIQKDRLENDPVKRRLVEGKATKMDRISHAGSRALGAVSPFTAYLNDLVFSEIGGVSPAVTIPAAAVVAGAGGLLATEKEKDLPTGGEIAATMAGGAGGYMGMRMSKKYLDKAFDVTEKLPGALKLPGTIAALLIPTYLGSKIGKSVYRMATKEDSAGK